MRQGTGKRNGLSRILEFIANGLPGTGYVSDLTADDIFKILSADKKIFVKIIPLLISGWIIVFLMWAGYYAIAGPYDCTGHPGPFLPSFFCEGDKRPIFNAVVRFLKTTFWFIIVVEALLISFLLLGKLARTKYNVAIPKPVMVLFWVFVVGLCLTFLGLMIFG